MRLRCTLLACLITVTSVTVTYGESENWLYGGVDYSKALETTLANGSYVRSTMDSIGANLSAFTFWNRANVGLYVHDSFLFPISGTISSNGQTLVADLASYDFLMSLDLIVGPGFRHVLGKALTLYGGFGFHIMQLTGTYSQYASGIGTVQYSLLSYNLGAGADLGFKLDMGTAVFMVGGISVAYDPINHTSVETNYTGSVGQWAPSYSYLAADPYLAVGLSFYQSKMVLGKPK